MNNQLKEKAISCITEEIEKLHKENDELISDLQGKINYSKSCRETMKKVKNHELNPKNISNYNLILWNLFLENPNSLNSDIHNDLNNCKEIINNYSFSYIVELITECQVVKNKKLNSKQQIIIDFFEKIEYPWIFLAKLNGIYSSLNALYFKFDTLELTEHILKTTDKIHVSLEKDMKEFIKSKKIENATIEKYYQNLLEKLKKEEYYIDYTFLKKAFLSDKIIEILYNLIYENLTILIMKIEKENQKLITNKSNRLIEQLLISCNIPINFFKPEELTLLNKYGNFEKIKEFLGILKIKQINYYHYYSNDFTLFLLGTTKEEFDFIIKLIENKILNFENSVIPIGIFFNEENDIFKNFKYLCNSNPLYQNILKNLVLLKKANVDFNDENYLSKILLEDEKIIKHNYYLFQFYKEYIDLELNNPCLFLHNSHLISLIDTLIEKNINPNNIDFNSIISPIDLIQKRIQLASKIGMNILRDNQINPILESGNYFYIDNTTLNDLIPNSITKNEEESITPLVTSYISEYHPLIEILDTFCLDGNCYNFNEIRISRKKIIYLLNSQNSVNMNTLFSIILYQSHLNEEEKNRIYECINLLQNKTKKFLKK